jgi:hypothetical protein
MRLSFRSLACFIGGPDRAGSSASQVMVVMFKPAMKGPTRLDVQSQLHQTGRTSTTT